MSIVKDDAIYRETPEFVEELEGTDTSHVRSVYQALRFQPAREDLTDYRGRRLPTPDLPGVLSKQAFRVGDAWAVVMRAERPEELRVAQHAVMKMLPDGWLIVLSRYEHATHMKKGHQAGVGAFSLPEGAP